MNERMKEMKKQWQVTVYLSKDEEPYTIYGDTHETLREEVCTLLCEKKPDRITCGYHTYRKENGRWIQGKFTDSDQKAYADFCRRALDIRCGPEYIDHGFIDGRFRLEYVKTVTKYHDVDQVNKMLKRGWHILALEQQDVEPKMTTTYYILGHIEENAM